MTSTLRHVQAHTAHCCRVELQQQGNALARTFLHLRIVAAIVSLRCAERQFNRDLAFALWLPLVLAAFAVRSCDAPGAAPGTCEATKGRGLALSSFPCGAHVAKQVGTVWPPE